MEARGDWPTIREILSTAIDKEPGARSAFLDQACSRDEMLRHKVDTLLAAFELSDTLSNFSPGAGSLPPLNSAQVIGPYRLVRRLGAGGMGEVWLAEQTAPVSRTCALKLIRGGIYDADAVRRFQSERQSLALMDHPSIAKIFDAGATTTGQPYFAMEFVDGPSIVDYCNRSKLSIRRRLALFVQVCEGIQHAHQKAMIHRDIKPSNILVIEVDGKPRPRIIDFGLAKTIAPSSAGETMFTHAGALLGTPGYMSPEQADPRVSDIDTRTDVYSLGVVLYELLTGYLPFSVEGFKKRHLDEMMRELREALPQRPSTKVTENLNTAAEAALDRGTEPGVLASLLRGDLDWITMKALEKDRDRRYGTPVELAADIERYLHNMPVLARPAGTGYRLRKYVRRHRLGVSLAATGAVLATAFAVMQAIQLHRITRERDRADRITQFMTGLFKVSDPSESRGNTVTAREILDRASKQIDANLGQDAEVRDQMMQVMALTYSNLGLYSRSQGLADRALASRRRLLGEDDPATLASMTQVGFILYHEGRDREAEQALRAAIDRQTRQLGPDNRLTLESEDDLAIVLTREGRFAEAEKLSREVLAIRTKRYGGEDLPTLRSMDNLADALEGQSKDKEADTEFRRLLAMQQRVLGKTHPETLVTMQHIANLLQDQDRYDEAEAIYREALGIALPVLGPEHPYIIGTSINLANTVVHDSTREAEAEALYRKTLAIQLRIAGQEDANTTRAEEGLANLLSSQGHDAEAEKLLKTVLAVRQKVLGFDHTDTLITEYNLGTVLFHEHRLGEAEKVMRETMSAQAHVLGPENPDTLASMAFLAHVLLAEDHPEQAEPLARKAFDTQLRVLGPQHSDTLQSLNYLGHALLKLRRYEEAATLWSETITRIASQKDGNPSHAWYDFARLAAAAGHKREALDCLQSAVKAGYDNPERMRTDEDLKSLRGDHRFTAILAAQKA